MEKKALLATGLTLLVTLNLPLGIGRLKHYHNRTIVQRKGDFPSGRHRNTSSPPFKEDANNFSVIDDINVARQQQVKRPICEKNKIAKDVKLVLSTHGYDIGRSNPFASSADPGWKAGEVFRHDCDDGFYDFVTAYNYLTCTVEACSSHTFCQFIGIRSFNNVLMTFIFYVYWENQTKSGFPVWELQLTWSAYHNLTTIRYWF